MDSTLTAPAVAATPTDTEIIDLDAAAIAAIVAEGFTQDVASSFMKRMHEIVAQAKPGKSVYYLTQAEIDGYFHAVLATVVPAKQSSVEGSAHAAIEAALGGGDLVVQITHDSRLRDQQKHCTVTTVIDVLKP